MWGRIKKIVNGGITYVYTHRDYEAADSDTDWYGTRVVTDGDNKDIKTRRGSPLNYATDDWND